MVEGEENKVTSNNYVLTVSEPGGTFFFSVHQQDVRCANKPPYVDIGVTVLQEKEHHSAAQKVGGASDESRKHTFIGGVSNLSIGILLLLVGIHEHVPIVEWHRSCETEPV